MQRILFFLWLLPVYVSANPADVPGAANLPGIERYPNAAIVRYVEGEKANYPLVASTIKKVNGVVRADEEQRLDGQWMRVIYLLPDGHNSDVAFKYFSDRFNQLGMKTIYSCGSRHCGPSNLWANKVFEEANLYGLDKEQFYLLAARQIDNQTEYYVLYAVKRGNRRVYAMVDRLVVDAPLKMPAELVHDNKVPSDKLSARYVDVVLKQGPGAISQQDIDRILALMRGDSSVQLLLAGASFRGSDAPVDQQLEASRQAAELLKAALIEHGAIEEQLFTIGTGPLLHSDSGENMPFVRVMSLK